MVDFLTLLSSDDNPYPEIENAIFSPETLYLLKKLNFSKCSELTAITTYMYQSFIISPYIETLSKMLEKIAESEMNHYKLLSDAIVEFGGDPEISYGNKVFWSGRFVDYTRNINRFLENNIHAETCAIAQYTAAAHQVNNISLANLLLRIAQDEMIHKRAFEQALLEIQE